MPYNWCDHNIFHADALARLVERAFNASGGQKVHLVAHSMGNLPTKLYLALRPQHASRYVASWTALAAPFLGAGAVGLETVLQGRPQLPVFFLSKELDHALQVVAPASYELLPADDQRWGDAKAPSVAYQNATSGVWINVTMSAGFPALAAASLAHNSIVDPNTGRPVPLPFGWTQLSVAEDTVRRLVQAPLAHAFAFPYHGVVGTGTPTPLHMVFADPVADLAQLSKEASRYSFLPTDGDGVVPLHSSQADGFSTGGGGTRTVYEVPTVGHFELATDQRVVDLVTCLLDHHDHDHDPAHEGSPCVFAAKLNLM